MLTNRNKNKRFLATRAGNRKLRCGYTTGACAAAAAKAAARVVVRKEKLSEILSTLPNGQKVLFKLNSCVYNDNKASGDGDKANVNPPSAICSIIKDAGDDPDCTHGAEIFAKVELNSSGKIEIKGGKGIAIVTKKGLGLEVGTPAINPVPRKNITEMVQEELSISNDSSGSTNDRFASGAVVEIFVPTGEELALKTINARLGLIGGISILGTTGIVRPFSTPAYKNYIREAIQMAVSQGCKQIVLTTGGRSEKWSMDLLKNENDFKESSCSNQSEGVLKECAFIQVGDYIGYGLKMAVKFKLERVVIAVLIGKLVKLAQGIFFTHIQHKEVSIQFLADLVFKLDSNLKSKLGGVEVAEGKLSDGELVHKLLLPKTARGFLEICKEYDKLGITNNLTKDLGAALSREALEKIYFFTKGRINLTMVLFDFEGQVLAHISKESTNKIKT